MRRSAWFGLETVVRRIAVRRSELVGAVKTSWISTEPARVFHLAGAAPRGSRRESPCSIAAKWGSSHDLYSKSRKRLCRPRAHGARGATIVAGAIVTSCEQARCSAHALCCRNSQHMD